VPIYEYKCDNCSAQFELKYNLGDEPEPCPRCRGKVRRVFSPVPVIFKGSGFYITDSRGKNSEPST
jgi:putative FmdB family regulatory protein